jgi:hypothetical protein
MDSPVDFFIVAFIGIFVGCIELLSRYRDDPFRSLLSWGAFLYLFVNALAAVSALILIHMFAPKAFDGFEGELERRLARILVAGFGAIAILRSSIFRLRIDQSDVAVGPLIVLETLLRVCDREVDRNRAVDRANRVPKIMLGLPPALACTELPLLCLALMQNLSTEEQKALGDQIRLIGDDKRLSDSGKAVNAGLLLCGFVGFDVLSRAVDSIKARPVELSIEPVSPGRPATNEASRINDIMGDLAADRASPVAPRGNGG